MDNAEWLELFVTGLPAGSGHVSCLRAVGVASGNEAAVSQSLGGVGFLRGVEGWIELEQKRICGGWIGEIGLPAADAGANEPCNHVGVLGGKVVSRELDAVGIVARGTDEQGTHVGSRLFGKERLAGDKYLLNVAGVGEEVGDGECGGNLADVVQVIAEGDVLEPGGAGLRGDSVTVEILEVVDGRVFVDHDGLWVVLHGGGDGDQRQPV